MSVTIPSASGPSRGRCDPALLAALAAPAMYPGRPDVLVHETHASWVFVAGPRTYKLKKPVALDFLDYSTLALRREACREEVRVNQELAAGLYLGVRAVLALGAGFEIARETAPGAVEYLVEMQSFDERDTFAALIARDALTKAHVVAASRLLAAFHRSAAVVRGWGPERVLAMWRENLAELERLERPPEWCLDVPLSFGEAFVAAHTSELRRRARLDLARDGHGDLRCEHLLARPVPRAVDRIEFDPALRRNDIGCDLAFLTMDLEASGARWAARELIEVYRKSGMDPGEETLRSFYAAHWALVRAKVTLIACAEHDGAVAVAQLHGAQQLWELSERLCWRARMPLAVVICGGAATGKTVLAAELSRRSRLPVVSSDLVRKRLAHLASSERADERLYSPGFTRATYAQLTHDALVALRRDGGVIVDATCRSRQHRAQLFESLNASPARLLVVRCEASLALVRERAARRLVDRLRVSDATPQIAEMQFHDFDAFDGRLERDVLELDTTLSLDRQVAGVTRALDRLE